MNQLVHKKGIQSQKRNSNPSSQQNFFICSANSQCLCTTAYLFSKDQRENSYPDSQQKIFFCNILLVLQGPKSKFLSGFPTKCLYSQWLTCSLGRGGEGWVRGWGCRGWRGGPPAGPTGSAARATAGSPACSGTPTQATSIVIRGPESTVTREMSFDKFYILS